MKLRNNCLSIAVDFIARGKHLEAMRRDGLRIDVPEQIHIKQVNATDDPKEIGVADIVLLCVKLWDTEQRSPRSGRWWEQTHRYIAAERSAEGSVPARGVRCSVS